MQYLQKVYVMYLLMFAVVLLYWSVRNSHEWEWKYQYSLMYLESNGIDNLLTNGEAGDWHWWSGQLTGLMIDSGKVV